MSMVQDRLESRFTSLIFWASHTELLLGDERIKVFHWMSQIEYKHHHDDLSKDLLAQSGQWLLESKSFIEWRQSSVSSILWLHGPRK